jgi:nucleoside-diphosphate-sugar epimerase
MIVGKGLIATSFKKYFEGESENIIFASGVSNSKESRESEFLREEALLRDYLQLDKKIIYFSTCSLMDPGLHNTAYVNHKKRMEDIVQLANHYAIFRLPQVVGKDGNNSNLANYIFNMVKSELTFDVWANATRNFIDIEDAAGIASYLINNMTENLVVNIASPLNTRVIDIVNIFECILEKKAHFNLLDMGTSYSIDSMMAVRVGASLGIYFERLYVEKVLRKYYEKV